MSLLGIDLGTTGVRAAAYSTTGRLLAEHAVATSLTRAGELVETDAEAVLTAVYEAAAHVASSEAVLKDGVAALSFSVQGEAVVPVDAQGRAIAPAPVSMDRRGTHAASAIGDQIGHAAFQRITGQPLHPMFSIFKIAAAREGWTSGQAAGYRTLDAFVAGRLGAAPAADYSLAARTGAFDVQQLSWSDTILAAASNFAGFTITTDQLPEIAAPGQAIGSVDAGSAPRLGIAAGTPIVAGLHDQAASFLGAGGRIGGPSIFALGSSDCLTVVTTDRPSGLEGTGFASYPIGPDAWVTLAGTAAGGWALEWFAQLVGESVGSLFDDPAATPPELIVLPYLAGSGTLDNDPQARGLVAGLTLGTTRAELSRAFLESTGYELAKIAAAFEARGVVVGPIRAVGTGAGNRRALTIRANATGRELGAVSGQASARGAALVAGIGVGAFSSLDELPEPELAPGAVPDPEDADWYAQQRVAFADLYASTSQTIHSLTKIKETN